MIEELLRNIMGSHSLCRLTSDNGFLESLSLTLDNGFFIVFVALHQSVSAPSWKQEA